MRIPKYIYYLDGTVCSAVLDAKTNVVVAKDKDEQFFRKTLSGDVTFFGSDFMKIVNTPIDTKLSFVIKRYDPDNFLVTEFVGYFTKADCEIDFDNSYLTVSIKPDDVYEDFLYHADREHNLVDICPDTWDITYKKKDFIQLYVPGDDQLTCIMGDNYWTQQCSVVTDDIELHDYGFKRVGRDYDAGWDPFSYTAVEVTGDSDTSEWHGVYSNFSNPTDIISKDGKWGMVVSSDMRILFKMGDSVINYFRSNEAGGVFGDYIMTGRASAGTEGLSINARVRNVTVYARIVTNSTSVFGKGTTPFGENDISADNNNYKYYIGYSGVKDGYNNFLNFSRINPFLQTEPTKYGRFKPSGEYYMEPSKTYDSSKFIPVGKNVWNGLSIWFDVGAFNHYSPLSGENAVLRDAYSIGGTIKALLSANESDVKFEESYEYSYFLYYPMQDGIVANNKFYLSQKTNILNAGYTLAATKTPISINNVLDMLRTTMGLYWYIDADNRLRIEHISFFMNGLNHGGTTNQGVAFDMTKYNDTRTNIPITRASNKVSFDSEDIPLEIKFEYDDACSDYFIRSVISPISGFVNIEKKESWSVKGFSVDVDRMIASPEEFSKDGFALLACLPLGLPDGTFALTDYGVQNHVFSLSYLLDKYLKYNLPFGSYKYNGEVYETTLRKKLMTQNVDFIYATDLDPNKLIKTQIGYGSIEKISVNLATRNHKILLKYDTAE